VAVNNNKSVKLEGLDRLLVVPPDSQAALFTGLGIVPIVIALLIAIVQKELSTQIVIVLPGVVLSSIFVLAYRLQWRYSFDRQRGELIRSNLVSKSAYPLSAIQYVDVQDGGLHEIKTSDSHNGGEGWHTSRERGTGKCYRTYICRVVIETDGERQEVQVSNHSDRKATKAMARKIAEFVGVPFGQPEREPEHLKDKNRRNGKKRR